MNEKKIIEIVVPISEAIKQVTALQDEIGVLTDQQKKNKRETQTEKEAYAANQAVIKEYKDQLRATQKEVSNTIKSTNAKEKSLNQLKAELSLATAEYNKLSKTEREAAAGVELKTKIKSTSDELQGLETQIGDSRRGIGEYERGIGGVATQMGALPGPVGKAATSITGMTKAALAFIATPLGGVIAAIGAAIGALTAYFKGSEEGQNNLAKITGILTSLFNNMMDVVQKLGKFIFDAFSNPKQALQDFGNLIKENIQNRIDGMLELFPALGKAISLVFKGEFKEAGKVAGDALGKVVLGVDDVSGKIDKAGERLKAFGKEMIEDGKIAARVAAMRAQADTKERKLIEDRAQIEAKIAELRLKAREDDKFTAEQRMAFIKEAGNLQDDLAVKERGVVALRYEAIRLENTLSNTTKEDLKAESEAKAALFQSDTKRDQAKKRMLRDLDRISNELAKISINTEKEKQAELDKIQKQAEAEAEKLRKDSEAARIEEEKTEAARRKEQLSIEAQAEYELKKAQFDSDFKLQRFELERKYQAEIAAAEKVGADTTAITKLYADAQTEIKKRETENAINLASGFAGNIAQIFGKNTKVGKMAASAQIAIDTYKGAIAAYSSLAAIPVVGIPLGIAAAGAAVAAGARAIKDVWAVKSGLPGDTGGGGGSIRATTSSQPPSRVSQMDAPLAGATTSSQPPSRDSQMAAPLAGATTSISSMGGSNAITSGASQSSNLISYDLMADAMSKAFENMPPTVVTVKDIETAQNKVRVIDNLTSYKSK
jgi:hypothetical protein